MESRPTVTISLPSRYVERRTSRDGHEFFVARLPEGTRVDGVDLSGCHVCATLEHSDATRVGITRLSIPAGVPRRVRRPQDSDAHTGTFAEVDPASLRDAVASALEVRTRHAVGEQVTQLIEAGDLEAAYETLGTLIHGETGIMPPASPAQARRDDSAPRHDMARGYEAVGILPAFLPTCSVDTYSPTATVPERFTHVAFDAAHCVTRAFFDRLLERARVRSPRYAGVLDEHGIGYVARQLAHPFARRECRPVAEVNGIGVDFGDEVMTVDGARVLQAAAASPARDSTDLGAVSVFVDRTSLIERYGMSADEASAVAERICSCAESELALSTGRIGAAHVSALLRSPDAARVLLEQGATIENPATGERIRLDPSTGRLACDLRGIEVQPDDPAFVDCCLLHVATDNCWRVRAEDAVRLANGSDQASRDTREAAHSAYLNDKWLYPRQRQDNLPTREHAEALLFVRDDGSRLTGTKRATGARMA